jgi:Na+-transporting methylmalonyl-CoA/oxaloacetate decarboxylase gamma subunit
MNEIEWAKAVKVFIFGFGGVFICLALLTLSIQFSSSIIKKLVNKENS